MTNSRIVGFLAVLALLMAPSVWAKSTVIVIRGGTIHTVSKGKISNGLVFIRDGKIVKVVAKGKIPAQAKVIDAKGRHIIPGLVEGRGLVYHPGDTASDPQGDAATSLLSPATRNRGRAQSPGVRVSIPHESPLDSLHYFDPAAQQLVKSGVTSAYLYLRPSSGLGGVGAVVKITGSSPKVLSKQAGVGATFGRNDGRRISPLKRLAEIDQWEKILKKARRYQEGWKKYRSALKKYKEALEKKKNTDKKKKSKTEKKGKKSTPAKKGNKKSTSKGEGKKNSPKKKEKGKSKKLAPPKKPKQSEFYDVLVDVLEGEVPVVVRVHRKQDILELIALAGKWKIRLVLDGASEAHLVASQIKKAKGVSLLIEPPLGRVRSTLDYENHTPKQAALLVAKGIQPAIGSYGGHGLQSRFLRLYASQAVSRGLSPEKALYAVTLGPAKLFGIDKHVGSLEKGKDADLVILSGPPDNALSTVETVWIDGKQVYQRR